MLWSFNYLCGTVGIVAVVIIRESGVLKMDCTENIVICKCEDITLDEIKNAIKNGAKDINSIKRITRAGMGCCQGHVCETIIQKILIGENVNIDARHLLLRRNPPLINILLKEIANL